MEKKSVMLEYSSPPYSTYHYLACAGIVTAGLSSIDNWYYNNTLMWFCSGRLLSGFSSPELMLTSGSIWDMDFVEKKGISLEYAENCLTEIACSMLDNGNYAYFSGVDDYYIKGKSWYRQRHFKHDGLIIGYSGEARSLTVAAYDENWVFRPFEISFSDFNRAARSRALGRKTGGIWAVKAHETKIGLDLEGIKGQLEKYLEGPVGTDGNYYGVRVYRILDIYLRLLQNGLIPHSKVDRRIFRLVSEHKQCMLSRISAIEAAICSDCRLYKQYLPTAELSKRLAVMYAKYCLKEDGRLNACLREGLDELMTAEGRILKGLKNRLQDYLEERNEKKNQCKSNG